MPDHDELCPQRHQYRGHKSRCVCALLAAARADERQALVDGPWNEERRHAEAVAAKLVEVIRVDDLRLRTQKGHTAQARRERDAARAEVEEIRATLRAESRLCAEARAEVAALTDALDIAKDERYAARVEQARAAQRLRDLRAKVEGLEHDATCSFIPQDGPCDCVRGAVLALLDEVDHG